MNPFYHSIIDNFFDLEIARKIESEFPDYYSDFWFHYNNPLEKKKSCNNWCTFKEETYKTFCYLNSPEFIDILKKITGIKVLYPDIGLHGGGLHISGRNDKLNIHLDYSIHPKLNLQRKLNLIIYMTENWNSKWGGNLELWSHDEEKNKPKKCERIVENIFNRAILFDTTQNSWHGYEKPLSCPQKVYRKSLAVYYLTDAPQNVETRKRALYSPSKEQENDENILNLIKIRSSI